MGRGETGTRKFWGHAARERHRRFARKEIRERILRLPNDNDHEDADDDDPTGVKKEVVEDDDDPEWIRSVLLHIVKNFSVYFSLRVLHSHARQFEAPFPTAYLYCHDDGGDDEDDDHDNGASPRGVLVGQERLHSYQQIHWFGRDETIDDFLGDFSSSSSSSALPSEHINNNKLTFYEYAVWLRRSSIVASLILGGINPCVRDVSSSSSMTDQHDDDDEEQYERGLRAFGSRVVLNRFLAGKVPLSMSSYVVTRVLELRRRARRWRRRHRQAHQEQQPEEESSSSTSCSVCHRRSDFNLQWHHHHSHPEKDQQTNTATSHHHHVVCELCLWKDIVKRMEEQTEESHYGTVIVCPVCGCPADEDDAAVRPEEDEGNNERCVSLGCDDDETTATATATATESRRRRRFEESRAKYMALPMDSKQLPRKKRRGEWVFCKSWSTAVRSKLGSCRSLRREKFFAHAEEGNYHYVAGCIDQGIDLILQNEYGQTALFIASWRGFECIVRLLLSSGSDPSIVSNGGLNALGAARANGHDGVVQLLLDVEAKDDEQEEANDDATNCWRNTILDTKTLSSPQATALIEPSSEHPGAGSYTIDDAVSSETVDALVSLWKTLPVATETKQKTGPCSVRSYFCDAEGLLRSLLEGTIRGAFFGGRNDDDERCGLVLSHMRFLHYSEPGLVLPPHTDLLRVDLDSGESSTHTFILYLTDCEEGGATALLEDTNGDGRHRVLARVAPKRMRLLLFPHQTPHEGEEVVDVPKLLVRGEVILRLNRDLLDLL